VQGQEDLRFVSEYELERSLCTPDANRHLSVVLVHLRRPHESDPEGMARDIEGQIRKYGPAPRLCWFHSGMNAPSVDGIVKYEYTNRAKLSHWATVFGWAVAFHIVLLNLYYRGVVYIVCGPRRVQPLAARADEEDYEQSGT
jgi:hypothetical protein